MRSLNTTTLFLLVSLCLHVVIIATSDDTASNSEDDPSYEDYDPDEAVKMQIYETLQS